MASLTHWDPMTDIASLREEVNRIFGRKMGAAIGGHWVPPMDILDTAEAVDRKSRASWDEG